MFGSRCCGVGSLPECWYEVASPPSRHNHIPVAMCRCKRWGFLGLTVWLNRKVVRCSTLWRCCGVMSNTGEADDLHPPLLFHGMWVVRIIASFPENASPRLLELGKNRVDSSLRITLKLADADRSLGGLTRRPLVISRQLINHKLLLFVPAELWHLRLLPAVCHSRPKHRCAERCRWGDRFEAKIKPNVH